jgi:hypothetical protein
MAGFGKDKKIESNWQNDRKQNYPVIVVTPSATN